MRRSHPPIPPAPPGAPRPGLWLGIALVITLLLITALPNAVLEPGGSPLSWTTGRLPRLSDIIQWLVLLTLPLYVALLALFWPAWRTRRTLVALLLLGAALLGVGWWVRALVPAPTVAPTPQPLTATTPQLEVTVTGEPGATPVPAQTERLPEPPAWLAFVITLAMIGALAVGLGGLGRLIWRSRSTITPSPLAALAQEAHSALAALQAGDAWEDVIVRCYQEMMQLLETQRAIYRPVAMTPREFENRLVALGAPRDPVQELTRLFEAARYGQRRLGPAAEQRARASLRAIATAYGSESA